MNRNLSVRYVSPPDEFQRLVLHALGMRPELRKVFLLCEVRGSSIEEAARILGIASHVAVLRLERARREMKVLLAKR